MFAWHSVHRENIMKPVKITSASSLFGLLLFPLLAVSQITETKIIAHDGGEAEYFGISVSIDGDRATVGATSAYYRPSLYVYRLENRAEAVDAWILDEKLRHDGWLSGGAMISGDYLLAGGECDSVHVYRRFETGWVQEGSLARRFLHNYCRRGYSFFEDVALVGATSESVFVFRQIGVEWIIEASLASGLLPAIVSFGSSVSVTSGRVIVSAATSDEHGDGSGSAYIFKREGTTWVKEALLTASDASSLDYFGGSVSISGDYAIVGASGAEDYGIRSGAAYVFRRDGSTWIEEARLTASDGAAYDWFGSSVSISGDYALVGAYAYHPGVFDGIGSAYLYKREGTNWIEVAKLTASDGHENNFFGYSVSLSGNHAIVGAYFDTNENGWEAGAAYVYSGFTGTCNDYTNLRAHCDEGSTVTARVVLQNNIGHSGETVLFDIDGSTFPATIVDNGISSRASISVPGLGPGPHTVSLLDPPGCFTPKVVTCGSGNNDPAWDEDEARWRAEILESNTNSSPTTSLLGNFPNPFNPSTTINYQLGEDALVTLKIYNTLGQEVITLVNELQSSGNKSATWNGRNKTGSVVASGIYIYRLAADNVVLSEKMLFMK